VIGPTDLLHPSPAPNFKTFQVVRTYMLIFISFFLKALP